MNNIRQAAVAGLFYPADKARLRQDIETYLNHATHNTDPPKAIIAPHAGYIYSGPIAASAYASLACVAEKINRVVLLGPAHQIPFRGLAGVSYDGFATPPGGRPHRSAGYAKAIDSATG